MTWNAVRTGNGITYYEHDSKPLAVVPKLTHDGADTRAWQLVYMDGDDLEPLTKAIYTLAGAQKLGETVQGSTLPELTSDLNRAVRSLQPEHLAGYAEAQTNKRQQAPGRWTDGRFRTAGGAA